MLPGSRGTFIGGGQDGDGWRDCSLMRGSQAKPSQAKPSQEGYLWEVVGVHGQFQLQVCACACARMCVCVHADACQGLAMLGM